MDFYQFIFYGLIAVGAILIIALTIYRIDWARHPEKYKDLEDSENDQKESAKNSSRPGKAGKKRKKK